MNRIENFDVTQAETEGWSIFSTTSPDHDGRHQLQRCDERDVFPNDDQAWEFVARRALAGSEYHMEALRALKECEPVEFGFIQKYVTPMGYPI